MISLLSADSPPPITGLRVMYGDRTVASPKLVVVELFNRGFREVRREDYDGPLVLEFDSPAIVLEGWADFPDPESLVPLLEQGSPLPGPEYRASLTPLINPRERLRVHLVVDGPVEEVSPSWRIAGIRKIRNLDVRGPIEWSLDALRLAGLAVVGYLVVRLDR